MKSIRCLLWIMVLAVAPVAPLSAADAGAGLADGVLHYWSFDSADDIGRGSKVFPDGAGDITLLGVRPGGGWLAWLADGIAGKAVVIPKKDHPQHNRLNSETHRERFLPPSFTVAAWIRLESDAGSSQTRGIFFADHWTLLLSDRQLQFIGGAKSVVKSETVVPEGDWAHVAVAVSAPEKDEGAVAHVARLYIDGREVASGNVNKPNLHTNDFYKKVTVGNNPLGGDQPLQGQIDELAIWERALTDKEIAALQRLGGEGKALSSVVSSPPMVAIRAEKASEGASGGMFVLSRDNDRDALCVRLSYSGLGIPDTDYAPPATIQTFAAGTREIRIPVSRLEGSSVIGRDDVKATIEPGILYTVCEAAPGARVWLTPDWPTPPPARPKKIFAHYMGCYPVASAATVYHRITAPLKTRHDSNDRINSGGGRFRNWPLVPDGMKTSLEESADLEIRRALRGGIDGFAVDAWAGGQGAKDMFSALLKVARDKDYPFEVTICLDPATICLDPAVPRLDGMKEALSWIVEEHGQNPKLARRDGKPLIFGYLSGWIGASHGMRTLRQKPEFADEENKDLRINPDLRGTKAGWMIMADGLHDLERAAGTPLFFHYCMLWFFNGVKDKGTSADFLQAAAFMAGQFGAVGAFLGGGPFSARMAEAVRAAGAEWSQPMYYQYENLFFQGNDQLSNGSDLLRRHWEAARRNQSTLIQFITWNDYTENTHLAPAYETRYAVLDLNRYFVDWWKTGQEPQPEKDKIYLFHRKYPADATIYPFQRVTKDPAGVIEVLTILTEPGTVRLVGRGDAWEAPAGMSWKHFPVTPGEVKAEVARGGRVVLSLESPDPITDRPCEQMKSMMAISTEDVRHWHEDFGDILPDPLLRGLYADGDKDGLPNWFEMYWFGKWLDWSTATQADPKAIGAEGKTLLRHYLDQTDPISEAPTMQPSIEINDK